MSGQAARNQAEKRVEAVAEAATRPGATATSEQHVALCCLCLHTGPVLVADFSPPHQMKCGTVHLCSSDMLVVGEC